jgi:hypothetical protein
MVTGEKDEPPKEIRPSRPSTQVDWSEEPNVVFAGGFETPDPKVGITLKGPYSYGGDTHPARIVVGFLGAADEVEHLKEWFERCRNGIDGDESHHPFPGLSVERSFRIELSTPEHLQRTLPEARLRSIREYGKKRKHRFEGLLETMEEHLCVMAEADQKPDVVFVIPPTDLLGKLATIEYRSGGGHVHRDLRAAIKARAMRHGLRTQLIRDPVLTGGKAGRRSSARIDSHPADKAWNLLTAAYFKAGGFPWAPGWKLVPSGTCFVGVSFYRPFADSPDLGVSVAHAFGETGEAFVLRGPQYEMPRNRRPALTREDAKSLIQSALQRYEREFRRPPAHVVVHKRAGYNPLEREGFQDGIGDRNHDLVSVRPNPHVRLMRHAQYPPLRGTKFRLGDRNYIYTKGTIPGRGYPQAHVPRPLNVHKDVGDSTVDTLIDQVLLLTKMNWNSTNPDGDQPITLKFSERVGEIMRELAAHEPPRAQYSYYM